MTQPRGGTSTPVITTPDDQASIPFLGALLRLRAGSEHTGGTFALLEHTGERGYMSPLHLHRDDEETFLVLEGELRVEVGDDRHQVGPGGLALLQTSRLPDFQVDYVLADVGVAAPRWCSEGRSRPIALRKAGGGALSTIIRR